MEPVQDALQGAELEGALDDELLLEDLLEEVVAGPLIDVPTLALGCWGRQLCGADHVCSPGFLAGHGHLKNKFCDRCRSDGILISSKRICLASKALHDHFNNSNGRTVWTKGARLVNQTAKCTGPPVLIFQGLVPEAVAAAGAPVPEAWLSDVAPHSGAVNDVHFIVAKGTLVPSGLCAAARRGKVMRPVAGSGSTASSSRVSDQAMADEAVEARRNSAVKRAHGDLASLPSLDYDDVSCSHDGWSTSVGVASASPPHIESGGHAGHAPPWTWMSHEPPGMLEPMAHNSQSPWFHAPPPPPTTTTTTSRHSLLASHDALEEQIRTTLACVRSEKRVDTVSEEASGSAELWELGPGQLGACAPPSLTSREVRALSSLLPLLQSSAALLRSEYLRAPSRPPTAGTLPPSPPSSRPSTAGTCSYAASGAEVAISPHHNSSTRDVQTTKRDEEPSTLDAQTSREIFTQTPVHIDYTKGGLLIVAYVLMGLSLATAGDNAFRFFVRNYNIVGGTWLISGAGVVATILVSALFFNVGVLGCTWLLDRFGFIDDRMIYVLKTSSFARCYANSRLRRKMRRYAVVDEDNTDVHSDDIKANQGRLRRLLQAYGLACMLLMLCGVIFPTFMDGRNAWREEQQRLIGKFQNADKDGNGWLDPGEFHALLGATNASSSANFTHPPGRCECG